MIKVKIERRGYSGNMKDVDEFYSSWKGECCGFFRILKLSNIVNAVRLTCM